MRQIYTQEQKDSFTQQRLLTEEALLLDRLKRLDPENVQVNTLKGRLFDVYLTLGRFSEAEAYLSLPQQSETLLRARVALRLVPGFECLCDNDLFNGKRGTTEIPRFLKWKRIYSPVHSRLVWLHRCSKCGLVQGPDFEGSAIVDRARLKHGTRTADTAPDSEVFDA